MKYDKVEKQKSKERAEEEEIERLTDLYVHAETMPEFRVKAMTAGLSESKFMKWFRLFYVLRNNSMYSCFMWCLLVPGLILSTGMVWLAIGLIPTDAIGCGWKLLMVLLVAVAGVVGTVITVRHAGYMLETVKSSVWKKE